MIEIRGTTTLVGLLGWPTSHSLSPPMQNAGFVALALDWAYVPLPTPPELLSDAVRGLARVRLRRGERDDPAQADRARALRRARPRSRAAAGSVNTLVFEDGRVLGSSTDGDAVTSQIEADGRRALVLGAGGSSRAVVEALERAGAEVTVWRAAGNPVGRPRRTASTSSSTRRP